MARIIDTLHNQAPASSNSLAVFEDVNYEDMRKKYMENAEAGVFPDDTRDVSEIQASEDAQQATAFFSFFSDDEDFIMDENEALNLMNEFSDAFEGTAENAELFQKAQADRELIDEEDAASQIQQVKITDLTENADDPFLSEDFKAKSERVIKKLVLERSQETESPGLGSLFEEAREESNRAAFGNTTRTESPFGRQQSSQGERMGAATTTTTHTQSSYNAVEREKQVRSMYQEGNERIINFVVNGRKKNRQPKAKNASHFGGKRKFSIKSLFQRGKEWMQSEGASEFMNVGMMLCLQIGMAVVTKKYEFDGPKQMLSYLGMLMGVFYISDQLFSKGYDPRRLAMV